MAATSSESHEIAGQKGVGLLSLTTLLTPDDVLARIKRYRDALQDAKPVGGIGNSRVAVLQVVHCAPTMQEARATAETSVMWFHEQVFEFSRPFIRDDIPQSYRYLQGIQKIDTRKITFDYLHDHGMIIVGDPAHCIERLKIYHEAGVDLILCLMQLYTIPHEKVLQSIRLFGSQVIPYFQLSSPSREKPARPLDN
jgi:alkanesulfonate monooxygenase SsuD/methylene tetrahydromethanopterin reductase-like flavin-dependent oxidoreductase (luciferase family)